MCDCPLKCIARGNHKIVFNAMFVIAKSKPKTVGSLIIIIIIIMVIFKCYFSGELIALS